MSSAQKPRTIDIVERTLRKRYSAEKRFELYGLAAVISGLGFVALLFISIVANGHTAFYQSFVKLDIDFKAELIDPQGKRDPADLAKADYDALVKDALRSQFPQVSSRQDKRELNKILSSGAGHRVRQRVREDTGLIGTQRSLWLPVDDEIDLFFKDGSTAIDTIPGEGIASPTGVEGEVQVLLTTNSFNAVLNEVKESLLRKALLAEKGIGDLEMNLQRIEREIAALDRQLAKEKAAGNEGIAAGLDTAKLNLLAERKGLAEKAAAKTQEAAGLRKRAEAPGGDETLSADLPSYLVRINGGLVKASSVNNSGISGKVLLPLSSATEAGKGDWEILRLAVPEGDRRVKDQLIAWITKLQAEGRIEKGFNSNFFTSGDSREPELAGIGGAVLGSLYTLLVTLALSFPIGVAAAVYMEEFAPKNKWTDLIEVNINNLAAVPSIVFGLLGLAVFINFFGMPRSAPVVGGLVLTLMTLPTIIIAGRSALKSVPPSIREAALGVGASHLQAVAHHVLPLAMPGILTGAIIGMARALGETAPLLMIGMVAFIVDLPGGFTDPASVLPVQIYLWVDSPERSFVEKTSAAIMVLLTFLIVMNAVAVYLRKKFERRW